MRPLLLTVAIATVAIATAVARRWLDVVEVRGRSMAPTLLPGDLLLVERRSFARRAPRAGEIVLAADPRAADRELIKRVGSVAGSRLTLRGDAPAASTDSRTFGELPVTAISWRVALCYWPPSRIGLVRSAAELVS